MTVITARRAALALQNALVAEGVERFDHYGEKALGWVRPEYMNSLETGLKPSDDGDLKWFVSFDGEGIVRFEPDPFDESEHRPVDAVRDARSLFVRAFGRLGLTVEGVWLSAWSGEDTTVRFDVVTPMPEWLEEYDPANKVRLAHDATLVTVRFDKRMPIPGRMPGYLMRDGAVCLPRATVERLLGYRTYAGASVLSGGIDEQGWLFAKSVDPTRRASIASGREVVEDFWGNAVEVWHVPETMVTVEPRFGIDMPYEVGGRDVSEFSFDEIDAQYGPVPWEQVLSTPRP